MTPWLRANAATARDTARRDTGLRAEVLREAMHTPDLRGALERLAWAFDNDALGVVTVARVAAREKAPDAAPPAEALARAEALLVAAQLLREVAARHGAELDATPF